MWRRIYTVIPCDVEDVQPILAKLLQHSIESWLNNRDPYIILACYNPFYSWVGMIPYITNTNQGFDSDITRPLNFMMLGRQAKICTNPFLR